MDGHASYAPFSKPSWAYGIPSPSYAGQSHIPHPGVNGWHHEDPSPGFIGSSMSPDPSAAFFDPSSMGGGFQGGAIAPHFLNGNGNGVGGASGSHYHGDSNGHGAHGAGGSAGGAAGAEDKAGGKWRPDREAPVKNACLTCRGKKAKCDGARPICGQCSKKSLECVYVKSRRGGARKKREAPPPSALQAFLKKLDGLLSVQDPSLSPGDSEVGDDVTNVVRTFESREEIMTCYYNEVHPFLPVMPPRQLQSEILPTLSADSPFLLAVQTILVLIPHPKDSNPKSSASKRLRTRASADLGQKTMEVVEHMLAHESSIECVQALCILSLWEWGSAGNLAKNRARAGQAVQVGMELGMHEMDDRSQDAGGTGMTVEGDDWRRDMARRTWWVVYVAQLTAAIISGNVPVLGPDDPRIKVDFPVCSMEDRSWSNWVNTNRFCVRAFILINSVYYGAQAAAASAGSDAQAWGSPSDAATDAQSDRKKIFDVDQEVMELMRQAEATSIIDLVPGGEEEVVRNQQLSARLGLAVTHIHIHRQQAFPEVSLFSKRICGLPSAPEQPAPEMPLLEDVAVPQALADGITYSETQEYSALNNTMRHLDQPANAKLSVDTDGQIKTEDSDMDWDLEMDFTQEMWQPETYPEDLPAPWFAHTGGAAALYQPVNAMPQHVELPPLTATIAPITPSDASVAGGGARERRGSMHSLGSVTPLTISRGPHKAWGVDANSKIVTRPGADSELAQVFPPGISLARCATAAHTIVRLEVLHRSAVIAMWDGPYVPSWFILCGADQRPKWLPFCACGLVTGAYAFLLLALAVQAENNFGEYDDGKNEEVEALLTNVKVILAGLEAYGIMWGGIEVMANEVRAALEAAMRLPLEVRGQIESLNGSPPGAENGASALGFPLPQ